MFFLIPFFIQSIYSVYLSPDQRRTFRRYAELNNYTMSGREKTGIELCFLHLSDVNIKEFFMGGDKTVLQNNYEFVNRSMLMRFDSKTDDCDFTNPNISVKIVFDTVDQLSQIIEIFNIVELGYLNDFYKLLKGVSMGVLNFWKFFIGANWNPDKYIKTKGSTTYDLVTESVLSNVIYRPDPYEMLSSAIGSTLSQFSTNYTTNMTEVIIYGDDVPKLHGLTNINKQIWKMKRQNFTSKAFKAYRRRRANATKTNTSRIRPFTVFEYYSKSLGEWAGIYEYDEQGRRGLRFIDDIFYPLLHNAAYNHTFFDDIWNKISKDVSQVTINQASLLSLIYYTYKGVGSDPRWPKIKDGYYEAIYSKRSRYQFTKLKVFFNHPLIREFKIENHFSMNKRIYEIGALNRLLTYVYGHTPDNLKYTNWLRYEHPHNYLIENFRNVEEETKYYNLPPYNSTIAWIFHPGDVFDLNFWNPEAAWFSGFHPNDKRKIRPFTVIPIPIILFFMIPIPVPYPADTFAIIQWLWKYTLRSNITRQVFPFLDEFYDEPDEFMCLPAPPHVPDPRYGCSFPYIELMPPAFPPDKIAEMFDLNLCAPWRDPISQVEAMIQLVLTPSFGPLLAENPGLEVLIDLVGSVPIVGIKIINNATGEQGTDALPFGLWQCILFKLPLLIPAVGLLLAIVWGLITTIWRNLTLIIAESSAASMDEEIRILKQENMLSHKAQQMMMLTLIMYMQIQMKQDASSMLKKFT